MAANRWQRLWRVFHRALELAPGPRETLLARAECEDPDLANELRGLLAAHDRPENLLDHPPLGASALQPGARLGAWRLIRELGAGGMGVVWLAERADQTYEQLAAIKLLSGAYASPALLRHFLRERQILARLRHPDIAALLDGGSTPDGRPFLVMEYVQGVTLNAYWHEHNPPLEARLQIFCRICDAVDYAHRHLVIHRDLKPGNVLVDADGKPTLLDFGIASLLEADPDTPLTLPAEQRLTPDYASPELLRGDAVGTATDCYALGVMLYESLTGERPWNLHGLTRERALALIERHQPITLSRAAAKAGATPARVKALAGDLDIIVGKALQAEPDARYTSARDLAEDLRRHLHGEPVQARASTWSYRAGKFVHRHRLTVAASGIALALLLALTGALGWKSWQLNQALQDSRMQTGRAQALSGFLADLFLGADPEHHGGEPLTASALLVQGTARLKNSFEDQPAVKADLLTTLGRIQIHLGDYRQAENLLADALALQESSHGSNHATTAHTAVALGTASFHAGRYAQAEALARRALAVYQSQPAPERADARYARLLLATTLQFRGKLGEAEDALRRALDGPPLNDPLAIEGWIRLGAIAWGKGNYRQAEAHYRDALDLAQDLYGADSAQASRAMNATAAAIYRQGRYAEAEKLYTATLALRRKIYGTEHALVAETLGQLGALAYDQGENATAIRRLATSIALLSEIHGADSAKLASSHSNLALALMANTQYDKAEQHLQQALRLHRTQLGDAHPKVAADLASLGLLYLQQARYAQSKTMLMQALDIQRVHYGKPHFATAYTLNHLGRLHLSTGHDDKAREFFDEALAMRLETLDAQHPAVADTRLWLGRLDLSIGKPGSAAKQFDEALKIRRAALGVDDWRTLETAAFLGAARLALGQGEAARKLYETNLARITELRGASDHHVHALRGAAADRLREGHSPINHTSDHSPGT